MHYKLSALDTVQLTTTFWAKKYDLVDGKFVYNECLKEEAHTYRIFHYIWFFLQVDYFIYKIYWINRLLLSHKI